MSAAFFASWSGDFPFQFQTWDSETGGPYSEQQPFLEPPFVNTSRETVENASPPFNFNRAEVDELVFGVNN